jgi:SAM-dependent methyltransferase
MKHYMAAAHALRGTGPVLDIGCGSGHDLAALERFGVAGVGVDPSAVMVDACAWLATSPVVRSSGERLPFRSGSFAGAWIERVLMHVSSPAAVLAEAVRCVAPGGLLTIFEPDWSSLTVNGWRVPTAWSTLARSPAVGSEVGSLLTSLGCFVHDRVEERSWWTYEAFERITSRARWRADSAAAAWADDLRARAEAGTFSAEIVKVLWVATTPE